MKKNNDGYVLPFVLVVMIVLTIIATSLMTAALRNLQSQQKFTERMETKYAAEGEIEKIVAQLSNEENFSEFEYSHNQVDSLPWPQNTYVGEKVKEKICSFGEADTIVFDKLEIEGEDINSEKSIVCEMTVKSSKENPIITTQIEMKGKITKKDRDAGIKDSEPTFSITELEFTYKSYEISTGGGT